MGYLKFKYVRIQGRNLASNTMMGKGIFSVCWELVRNDTMEEEDAMLFREIDAWFADNLPWPPQCRKQEAVACWFKVENTDEMMKMIRPAIWLLEKYNHPYYLVYTNSPGEIVYEDKYQICAKTDIRIENVTSSWYEESTSALKNEE